MDPQDAISNVIGAEFLAADPTAKVLVTSPESVEAARKLLRGWAVVSWSLRPHGPWPELAGRNVTLWLAPGDARDVAGDTIAELADVRFLDFSTLAGTGMMPAAAMAAGWDAKAVVEWAKTCVRPWPPDRPHDQPVVDGNVVRFPNASRRREPDQNDIPPEYSDDALASRFTATHGHELRHVNAWGKWLHWDGTRWAYEETLYAYDLARAVNRKASQDAATDFNLTNTQQASIARNCCHARTIAAVERLARADRIHAATIDQWDADDWLLNTPAGTVDLRTGALRPHDQADCITKRTNASPAMSPKAAGAATAAPTWQAFLDTATEGDTELQAFLRRMAGYCLTGSTREHALFFFYGPGGNGKGTFLNTLHWILGDYATVAPMETFTESRNDRHTTELAMLRGSRMVTAQETEEGRRWAESRLTSLTGGDPITARFMRQDNFTFLPRFKLAFAGNHKPGLRSVNEAVRRRFHLVPFTADIPAHKRDTSLPEKLRAEANAILTWAIIGCLEWQANGLQAPARVIAATDEYLDEEDALAAFVTECCEVGKQHRVTVKQIYEKYRTWAESSHDYALPRKRFLQAMEVRGFPKEKGKNYVLVGIKVAEVGHFDHYSDNDQRDTWYP